MTEKLSRRDIVKSSAIGASAVAATVVVAGTASAQMEQWGPGKTNFRATKINPNATAVLPSGVNASRGEILSRLGLNPNTPPDAWLAIIACGSNASALLNNGATRVNPAIQPMTGPGGQQQ